MIDFRYHIVSLISVFVALAVGLLLGAGLLQGRLGDVLTNEVENLRASRAQMRVELDENIRHNQVQQQVMQQLADNYLPGSLSGVAVATIALPGALEAEVDSTVGALELSGAEVVGQLQLTPALSAAGNAAFVQAYASQLQRYLSEDASGEYQIFSQAIIESLTGGANGQISDDVKMLTDLLKAAEKPIINVTKEPEKMASALVIIGPRSVLENPGDPEPEFTDEEKAQMESDFSAYSALIDQASAKVTTVVYGSALTEKDMLWSIRDMNLPGLTTVDQSLENSAALAIPLAVRAARDGKVGHYGDDHGAVSYFPPISGDIITRSEAPKVKSDAEKRSEKASEEASEEQSSHEESASPADTDNVNTSSNENGSESESGGN